MGALREQLLADVADLYRTLHTGLAENDLRFADFDRVDNCRQSEFVAGTIATNDCATLLLGPSPRVPKEPTRWRELLDVRIDLHRPAYDCRHALGAVVAVSEGIVQYSSSHMLVLERGDLRHTIGTSRGATLTSYSAITTEIYNWRAPGARLGVCSRKERDIKEVELPIVSTPFSTSSAQKLATLALTSLEYMKAQGFDFESLPERFRVPRRET